MALKVLNSLTSPLLMFVSEASHAVLLAKLVEKRNYLEFQ